MNKKTENRDEGLSLEDLGIRIKKVDKQIIDLLAERMDLAKKVEECKNLQGQQPILRPEIEEKRLSQIKEWADEKGLNHMFAQAVFYYILSESCRVQIDQLESRKKDESKLS